MENEGRDWRACRGAGPTTPHSLPESQVPVLAWVPPQCANCLVHAEGKRRHPGAGEQGKPMRHRIRAAVHVSMAAMEAKTA